MTAPDPSEQPDPPEQSEADAADELRHAVRARWEQSADGWSESSARFTAATIDVSHWLLDAIEPQPGQRVLELAAGIGETGFLAAELIEPGGTLICTDGSEAMLAHAEARAAELGLRNVEFKPAELEWIDVPTADVDAVLCRWGYMFALDREAALRETRRVLRPGGRVALATWTELARNPWSSLGRQALYDAGLIDALELPSPSPFDLSTPEIVTELLHAAGFGEVVVDEVAVAFPFADVVDWMSETRALSRPFAAVVDALDARQLADLRARLIALAAPYAESDGSFRLPGVALVAAADA